MIVSFALPLLFAVLAWAAGRALLGSARLLRLSEGAALFVGLAAVVVVLSWCTFVLQLGTRGALFLLLPLLALLIALRRRQLAEVRWRDIALPGAVFVLTYVHYVWPQLVRPGTELLLMSANDFTHYVAVGSWLQDHSILTPVSFGADYNSLHANVADHQASRLRIGALLLLSLFGSAADTDVLRIYTGYSGFVLAAEAVAVTLIARQLGPSLPNWVAAAAGLLFGLCPTATWAAYASFLPQTLGLGFLAAGVAAVVALVRLDTSAPLSWRDAAIQALPIGALFCAAWSCYPEGVPLGALIVLAYLAIAFGPRLRAAAVRTGLLRWCLAIAACAVLLSPLNFWWGIEGMRVQVTTLGHGMEQHSNAWTLFATAIGAMQQPIYAAGGAFAGRWFDALSLLACAAALAGMFQLARGPDRALPLAIVVSGLVLFAFVMQRYSFARYGSLPDWRALFTWNLFKAASYLTPFVLPVAFVGVVALARRLGRSTAMNAVAVLFAGCLVAIALRQDAWAAGQLQAVRLPPDLRALAAKLPPGRLLLDFDETAGREAEYYRRYAIYTMLRSRAFVSTRDWQPPHLYQQNSPDRAGFFKQPFSHVLTDHPARYPAAREVAASGAYRLLDVASVDFAVEVHEWARQPQVLVNLAASGKQRGVAIDVRDPGVRKIMGDAADDAGLVPVAATVEWPVGRQGGLRQLSLDPPPPGGPTIVIREGTVTAPPPVKFDLKAQIAGAAISTDPNGSRMAVKAINGAVRMTMPQAGTSRAQLSAPLEAGEYVVHIELGEVTVEDQDPEGLGAFFGPENDRLASIELQPVAHSHHYLRLTQSAPGRAFFALGFGGWGKARGSIEIRKLEVVGQPKS